jgi:glutamine amidotransferase
MGNLASVAKALERVGCRVELTGEPAAVRRAGAVVLPGVGAFRDAAARLHASGLAEAIVARINDDAPFLGVCLGLQLLFESSGEGGRWQGLGVLGGTVERLETDLKVPHIGWNALEWREAGAGMAAGLPAPAHVYFVHSYAAVPADAAVVAAVTPYGNEVVAAVAKDNVWAVQFHPEKSSHVGLRLLANWVAAAREA